MNILRRITIAINALFLWGTVALLSACSTYSSKVFLPAQEQLPYVVELKQISIQDILGLPVSESFQRKLLLQNAQNHLGTKARPLLNPDDQGDQTSRTSMEGQAPYIFQMNLSFYQKENLVAGAIQYSAIGFLVLLDQSGHPVTKVSYARNYSSPLNSPGSLLHLSSQLFLLLKRQEKELTAWVQQHSRTAITSNE